uniref:Non-structural kinase n=1 Tax=Latid herpesvirus 1 TaxID=3096545 RepID=A0AB33V6V2_9VIRU
MGTSEPTRFPKTRALQQKSHDGTHRQEANRRGSDPMDLSRRALFGPTVADFSLQVGAKEVFFSPLGTLTRDGGGGSAGAFTTLGIPVRDGVGKRLFLRGGVWEAPVAREVEILKQLKHGSIMKFNHVYVNPSKHTYVMVSDCARCSLQNYDFEYPSELRTYLILDIIPGLKYLHNAGYVHMDLKPSNMVMTYAMRVKLIDFNLAVTVGYPLRHPRGTTAFIPPEVRVVTPDNPGLATPEMDFFSLGITVKYLTIEGRELCYIHENSTRESVYTVGERETLRCLRAFIGRLTATNPDSRHPLAI